MCACSPVHLQPIGTQQGRCAPPPPSMAAVALQPSGGGEGDNGLPLLAASEGGGDVVPSSAAAAPDAVGDTAGGAGSKAGLVGPGGGGSSVLQGGGSRGGMGSRKSSGIDPVRKRLLLSLRLRRISHVHTLACQFVAALYSPILLLCTRFVVVFLPSLMRIHSLASE